MGSASRPGRCLPPAKTPYPLYRRLGGPQGRSGQVRKISPPPSFDPRTVQPLAQSLYRLSYLANQINIRQNKYSLLTQNFIFITFSVFDDIFRPVYIWGFSDVFCIRNIYRENCYSTQIATYSIEFKICLNL